MNTGPGPMITGRNIIIRSDELTFILFSTNDRVYFWRSPQETSYKLPLLTRVCKLVLALHSTIKLR